MTYIGRVILFLAIFIVFRYLRVLLFKNHKLSRWQVAILYSFLWGGSLLLAVILFLDSSYIFPFGILLEFTGISEMLYDRTNPKSGRSA